MTIIRAGAVALIASGAWAFMGCGGDDAAQTGDSDAAAEGGGASHDGGGAGADGGTDATTRGDAALDGASNDGSSADSGTTTGSDVSGAVSKLDADLAAAVCGRLAACCSPGDADAFFAQFKDKPYTLGATPSAADCASVLAAQLQVIHTKWADSVKRGRMTFNPAAGAACVAEVNHATCGVSTANAIFDQACFGLRDSAIFQKIAPPGAACQDLGDSTFYGECDPAKGYCDGQACVAWQATGASCSVKPRLFCAPELSCDEASPTQPGKCSAPPVQVALGDACNAQTGAIQLCPANGYCDFGGTGTCVAKKKDGVACGSDEECVSAHAFTCYPAGGAGACGSTAYCNGVPDGGAPDGGASTDAGADGGNAVDAGAADGGAVDGGNVTDGGTSAETGAGALPTLTLALTDEPSSVPVTQLTAAQRDRVTMRWNAPGATSVALEGAGPLVAVVTAGAPTYDDMTSAGGRAETSPTQSSGIWGFRQVVTAKLPFATTIAGETWQGQIAISPHGVVSRGIASSLNDVNGALPIPQVFVSTDWSDGTLAPFYDRKLDSNAAGTSRIRTGSFGTGADARFVIEWSDMTTAALTTRPTTAHITVELAIYADGRVEYRYKSLVTDPSDSMPVASAALAQGAAATIGFAQSPDVSPPWALPLSIRRASLPATGVTYTLYPSSALPPSGTAIAVMPSAVGTASFTLKTAGQSDAKASATVEPMYSLASTSGAVRDISSVTGAQSVQFGGSDPSVLIELPFSLGVFREGWRALAVTRSGAIGPWGVGGLDFGLNGKHVPDPSAPNGFIASFFPTNGAAFCVASSTMPTVTWLVEGSAPSRTVTILMKSIGKCGQSQDALDVETVLHESGDVETLYGGLTSAADTLTGKGTLVGLEGGNGDVGVQAVYDTAGALKSGTRFVFTRHL